MAPNKITCVITFYNEGKKIARALNSVLNQSLKPTEIIIINDNGFEDVTNLIDKKILKNNKNLIKIKKLTNNHGPSYCRNLGIESASGDLIAFLDADDTWEKDKLLKQFELTKRYPKCKIFIHSLFFKNEKSNKENKIYILPKWRQLIKNYISPPTLMIRKELKLRFDNETKFMEDQKFGFECILLNEPVIFSKEKLTRVHKRRYGFGGISQYMLNMQKHELNNYYYLLKRGNINKIIFCLLILKSCLAFIKRLIFYYIIKILKR